MTDAVTYDAWINGTRHAPAGGRYLDSIDPTSGEAWARIARCTADDVDPLRIPILIRDQNA